MNFNPQRVQSSPEETTHRSPLILIIDDDTVMRLVLHEAMQEEGYRVIEAENGFAGLVACRLYQPDLILLESMMLEMDGFLCCQTLRSINDSTPILMVTQLQTSESVDRIFAVGATDYISQPIHDSVLRQRVRRLLQERQATQELQQRNQQIHALTTQLETQIQDRSAQLEQILKLENLHHLKDDFLSTVSHELRSPITNMLMSIQMLECVLNQLNIPIEQSTLFNKTTQYLKILRSECDREIQIINDLLDLQRLESGRAFLNAEAIELSNWILKLIEPYQIRTQNRQQQLKLQIATDLPTLYTDPACLSRILAELLNNACKYTPPGGTIAMSIALTKTLQFTVSNSGSEISPSELPRIFDKFYRIPCADRWQQGGTGLGLALVKRLVQHLNGRISVESAQQQTCFTIELPTVS